MDDLISRQAAIDALMEKDKKLRNINWYDKPYAEGECRGIDEALSIISNLPSAQPEKRAEERTETHACDLVERQAAIDALHMHLMYRMGTDSNKKRLDEWINNLPSVQPEHDYKKAFSVACELLIGANLFGTTEETMFREIMDKEGIVSSLGYEQYILDNLARLTGEESEAE